MKLGSLLATLVAAGALVASVQGCSSDANAGPRICTPGAYVFCRCADRAEGTKLCNGDGAAFGACSTDGAGACEGGEVEDPYTGQPVDPTGNPVDEGGVKVDLADACPGRSIAVTPGTDTVVEGDTTGAKDDAKGKPGACAVGGGGPDHVLRIVPKGTGALNVKVQGLVPLDPTVYMRTSCSDEATQIVCGETTPAGGAEQFTVNVVTGREYFLFIDGGSGSAGKYTATLKLTTGAFCGDGKVDPGEACDDGNKVDGDGCSPDCKKVNGDPSTGNACPGQPVDVWPNQKVTGTGANTAYGNTFANTGTACEVSASKINASQDHVYEVTPHATGTLKVIATPVEANFNVLLAARTTCTEPQTQGQGMCANDKSAGGAETMSFPVTSGTKVYVAVDGALSSKGSYNVSFEIQ